MKLGSPSWLSPGCWQHLCSVPGTVRARRAQNAKTRCQGWEEQTRTKKAVRGVYKYCWNSEEWVTNNDYGNCSDKLRPADTQLRLDRLLLTPDSQLFLHLPPNLGFQLTLGSPSADGVSVTLATPPLSNTVVHSFIYPYLIKNILSTECIWLTVCINIRSLTQ